MTEEAPKFARCDRCPNHGGCAGRCALVDGVEPATRQRVPCPVRTDTHHCIRWADHTQECKMTTSLPKDPAKKPLGGESMDLFG
jgi:hypothetical protein